MFITVKSVMNIQHGAGGGTRTRTMSPSTDFESVTSANSITPAYLQHDYYTELLF